MKNATFTRPLYNQAKTMKQLNNYFLLHFFVSLFRIHSLYLIRIFYVGLLF